MDLLENVILKAKMTQLDQIIGSANKIKNGSLKSVIDHPAMILWS
jgi:hypothetical protein